MKKNLLLAALSVLILVTSCSKSDDDSLIEIPPIDNNNGAVTVQGDITANTTWTADKIYLMKGNVFVTNNATLTIEPGTIIKGDKATKAALIITRGAKINATGTVDKPIVFTSNVASGGRKEGDWGGVILLGKAVNNGGTSVTIEGISDATDKGKHGGTENGDNSGTLKYVRIEFAGIALSPDNEINGLTFGSVGSGTTVDFVEVYRSGDDAYEWFGGTVNAKHLLAIDTWDDDFDTDNGFAGKIQFGLAQRLAATADVSGSNGFESDNNSNGTTAAPKTLSVFSNMTILGPIESANSSLSVNANFQHAVQIRRNSAMSLFNSVIAGYTEGVFSDDARPTDGGPNSSGNLLTRNESVFANNLILGSNGKNNQIKASSAATLIDVTAKLIADNTFTPGSYAAAVYTDPYKFAADIAGGARAGVPNFVQASGSPALTGAAFTNAKVNDTFFDKVAYKGAFGTENWATGWAHFDPQSLAYTTPGKVTAN